MQFITCLSTFARVWGMCDYTPFLKGPVLANNFAVSDIRDNTFGLLNRGCIVALPFLRTPFLVRQKSLEPSFWEEMDSFVLLAYPSLAASRVLLQGLLACWYKQKKWFLWTMAAAQAAESHRDDWGLTWYLWYGIYGSIPTWTHSQIH